MSNELSIPEAQNLSSTLSKSSILPRALQRKPEDILVTILTGQELGLSPMMAIRAINVIQGKPTLAAEAMGALCKNKPDKCEYLMLVNSTAEVATYETKRKGDPKPTTLSFSMVQARSAGIAGGDNWRKFPDAMLRARALSAICRAVYPDIVLGLYDPGELEAPTPPPERDVTPHVVVEPKPVLPTMAQAQETLEKHKWDAHVEFAHEDLPPGTNLITGEVPEDTSEQDLMTRTLASLNEAPVSAEVEGGAVILAGAHKGKSVYDISVTLGALKIAAKNPANGSARDAIEAEIKRREEKP